MEERINRRMKLYVISADTYNDSWGSQISIFGVFDSKFADALDKPYTKTASAAKEASSAVEKVAEASTSTASAVAEVGAATATSSASMTTMEAATAGLAAEETVATGATVGFGTAIKGFLVTVAPIAAALVAVGVAKGIRLLF